jgi:glycosyltransferase involved in cell wall biosynthesis
MKASILINNFNYGRYLKYAIDSALNQTYKDVEVIVYDDGSTDNSVEIITSYGDKITPILSSNHKASYPSYNQANAILKALEKSSGDVIFLLDSDDAFLENKVQVVMDAFMSNPNLVLYQHKFAVIDQDGKRTGEIRKNIFTDVDILKGIKFLGRLEFFFMQTSALALRREFVSESLSAVDDEFPLIWPDARLTRNAIFRGDVVTSKRILAEYRVHGNNDSDKLKNVAFFNTFQEQHYALFNKYARSYNNDFNILYRNGLFLQLLIIYYALSNESTLSDKIEFIVSRLKDE